LSFKALAWAFDQDVRNPEKSVLIALAYRDNHDEPHGCWPSIPRIAKDCGISQRTVQRSLYSLESLGLIHRRGRSHKSTFYFMPLAWVVSESHHPGVTQSPPLVSVRHPEPKVLTVRERKPRAQPRSARNYFDEEIEQRRRLEAKTKREQKEDEVRRELYVGQLR
jgi:DNA-binding transcriptional MocR family regulator